MNLDEAALEARFLSAFDIKSSQVLTLNKPSTVVDKSKPWVRFSVSLESNERVSNGDNPEYLSTGGAYLQVFIPKKLGLKAGDELVARYDNLFTDWRSDDGALQVVRMTRSTVENKDEYQHTIRYSFQSLRYRA